MTGKGLCNLYGLFSLKFQTSGTRFIENCNKEKHMNRKTITVLSTILLALVSVVPAFANPGKPNFGPAIYADGEVWGTKAVTEIPGPNGSNDQSFDKLFVIRNGSAGQMPVGEAAPGNSAYNGGRWYTQTVSWTEAGFDDHGTVPVLTSYDDIMVHYSLGHLTIDPGSPAGGPPPFFNCPLLPVK
jgi:hypothetical protein